MLKPAVLKAISSKIVALFRLDFIPRLLRLTETSKPTETILNMCQLIFSCIHVFAKFQSQSDEFESDTLFMIETLNKLTATGVVSENIKFQTVTLLGCLSQRDITRRPNVSAKFIETLCPLITDTNLLVANQSLQCLVDFLQFSPANNSILGDLIRSPELDTDAKLQIDNFIKEIPIQVNRSEKEILKERNERILEKACDNGEFEETISLTDEEELEEDENGQQMDETMNLLCAMDTTIASQSTSTGCQRKKEEKLIEQARQHLDELFVKLAGEKRSEWMLEQLNEIWQGKIEAL